MDTRPSSPRSAAIFYWGGSYEKEFYDEKEFDEERKFAENYDRGGLQSLRSTVKFNLTLHDERDNDHWLFRSKPLALPDLSHVEENTKEDIVEEVEKSDSAPTAHQEDFSEIPIIDLSQPQHIYARQIGEACKNVGFFYITNHNVPHNVMQSVMNSSREFFTLNLKDKLKACSTKYRGNRGYFGLGQEDLDNKDGTRDLSAEEGRSTTKAGDYKEGFDCGLETYEDDARSQFFGKNVWPDEENAPGFRASLLKYQHALVRLADKLLVALVESLNQDGNYNLPENFFAVRTRNPMCTLRLLHYPQSVDSASKGCGAGAHTDYGLFTILQQDSIGGLQVRNKTGQWVNAKPLKGSFVINVGDMLSHWSNGQYASTVHRVISPSSDCDRYSVPFFFNPDHDAIVKPLGDETDVSARSQQGKTALDILKERYAGTFKP